MQYIKNVPTYVENTLLKESGLSPPESNKVTGNSRLPHAVETIHTKISIDNIEKIINKTLDKYPEVCKYYINITETYWGVSFNVDQNQLEAMCETMFELRLFKDINN